MINLAKIVFLVLYIILQLYFTIERNGRYSNS